MPKLLRLALALILCSLSSLAQDRRAAEELYARGSFELAHAAYAALPHEKLSPAEVRWIEFRLADCAWRSAASTQTPDPTRIEEARKTLEELQRPIVREEQRDETWARIEESLGDFSWTRNQSRDFGSAWQHYEKALDWWAGARDLAAARTNYLAIVWRLGWPEHQERWYGDWWQGQIPIPVIENAIAIAVKPDDQARARFLHAIVARQRGSDYAEVLRGFQNLRAALAFGVESEWHDDALFLLAQWNESPGIPEVGEDGQWKVEADFVAALEAYRQIVKLYPAGDSRYRREAESAIQRILAKDVGVSTDANFLPGSEIGYHLSWRNVEKIELALYAVDLSKALRFRGDESKKGRTHASSSEWLDALDLSDAKSLRTWNYDTHDTGKHVQGNDTLHLEDPPGPGAYVIEAKAGGLTRREIVLIGSSTLFVRASADRVLVWFTDALTSEPIANADVCLWLRFYEGNHWSWRKILQRTGADGTCVASLSKPFSSPDIFVAARKDERQAFSFGGGGSVPSASEEWRLYVYTDRPAYRPKDTASWKLVARTKQNGSYATPANAKLGYEVLDPHGTSVKQGELVLNAFGSAWAELELGAGWPLGEYQIRFEEKEKQKRSIGQAQLFRLEEYKLPEFEVHVAVPEKDGKQPIFRSGDMVEAELTASYFFGGTVADANVEAIVYQRPYWPSWPVERAYPWYFDDENQRGWGGQGQVITRIQARTNKEGRATIRFASPGNAGQDFEYTIEARVTDSSRREISGSGRVRVTRAAYFVRAKIGNRLVRPGATAEFVFDARDANEHPVSVEGKVVITRERWREIWLDPAGREVSGRELEELRRQSFPPPVGPGLRRWSLKSRGYEHEEIRTATVKMDAKGEARVSLALDKEGYYSAQWTSRDDRKQHIEAAVSVWVANEASREIGYRSENLEILFDKDRARAGESLAVLLALPVTNRWVLVSVESDVLHSWQVVHVEGLVKQLDLALTSEHVPNVFLSASTASDGLELTEQVEIVVPPEDQFLDVELTSDHPQHRPGEDGLLSVLVKNHKGQPVAAEIGLSLVDESVLAIQSDYAVDPRRFFYGDKRGDRVGRWSSFQQRAYRRMRWNERRELVDMSEIDHDEGRSRDGLSSREEQLGYLGVGGGGLKKERGRQAGNMAGMPALAAKSAAAEAKDERSDAGTYRGPGDSIPPGNGGGDSVRVRSDFRETALWKPDLVTGADGRGSAKLTYPDSLTRWKAKARVASTDARFGSAEASVRTELPLQVRLQAPRFFVVGDEVTLSALVDNRTERELEVVVELAADGFVLDAAPRSTIKVPANGQTRVDWKQSLPKEIGSRLVRVSAKSSAGELSDAMEKRYPIEAHGIEAFVARSFALEGDELSFVLDVPGARRKDSTRFSVQVAPSLAVTMLDALPYLVRYPYGCTEQTLSRFLPAVIVAKTLRDRGLSAEEALSRAFGGIEESSVAATHPNAKRSLDQLDDIVRAGIERLKDFQHGDGGWGWWKEDDSDPFMSAYVVWGLSLAREAGIVLPEGMLAHGAEFLKVRLVEEEQRPDLAAWMLQALARHSKGNFADAHVSKAFAKAWEQKNGLNAYARALLALAAHGFGREVEARTLAENLANGATIDAHTDSSALDPRAALHDPRAPKTAHWGSDSISWRWSQSGVESTACALRALIAIDPKNPLVAEGVTWLVQNRRGAQWSNTRDTALSILALDDYLSLSGDLDRDVEYELSVNGKSLAHKHLAPADMLRAPSSFVLAPGDVRDGANEVRLKRFGGQGPLYISAHAEYFTLEEPIPPHGNELFVRRDYYKLVGRPTLLKGLVFDRVPLVDGGSVQSGERVEVVVTAEAKNDLEYLLFEDLKPAGLEAVEVKSGTNLQARELRSKEVDHRFPTDAGAPVAPTAEDLRFTNRTEGVHQELRDRKVALFVSKLPQGVWEMHYTLRAEVPGKFHALPLLGEAMYVPEIRANGAEVRLEVLERP